MRRMWGLEDEDEFRCGGRWTREEEEIFEQVQKEKAKKMEERNERG